MTPNQIQEAALEIKQLVSEHNMPADLEEKIAAILSRYADPGPGEELGLVNDLMEACGNLQHWHDTHYGGMIVSGDSVRAVWQARDALEKKLKSAPPSQVESGEPRSCVHPEDTCKECGRENIISAEVKGGDTTDTRTSSSRETSAHGGSATPASPEESVGLAGEETKPKTPSQFLEHIGYWGISPRPGIQNDEIARVMQLYVDYRAHWPVRVCDIPYARWPSLATPGTQPSEDDGV